VGEPTHFLFQASKQVVDTTYMQRFAIVTIVALMLFVGAGCSETQTSSSEDFMSKEGETTTTENQQEDHQDVASRVVLKTSLGDITIDLFVGETPATTANFLRLARSDFYDGTLFHRVIPEFMIQGGDPNSRSSDRATHGTGGPGYDFADESTPRPLVRGSLAMANRGPNTNGSQFFIVTAPSVPWLNGKHTNFGFVVGGMDVVDAIEAVERDASDHPIDDVVLQDVTILDTNEEG
jgi:cyclophilin family peptidyl-prolyl cis-trans isomerase